MLVMQEKKNEIPKQGKQTQSFLQKTWRCGTMVKNSEGVCEDVNEDMIK